MRKKQFDNPYMGPKFRSCCYKCTKRKVGCHSNCKEYWDAKKEHDELTNKIFEDKCAESYDYSKMRKSHDKAVKFYQRSNGYRGVKK